VRNYFVLATLAMLGACGGGNDSSPNASAAADKQVNAVDSSASAAAAASAASQADAANVQSEFKAARTIPLGMKTTTPPLVIADPTLNLPPYTPPAAPKAVSTTTLSFGDFTNYLAPGSTDGWRPGANNSTITIPAPPTNGSGAGDKTVALASTYATASYEADVTVSAPVGSGAANAGFIVRTTNPTAGGPTAQPREAPAQHP
jgi:hypothetical protein